jgi:hypothetical protein
VHRPRRIALCPSQALQRRQRGSDTYQMQKLTAGKFHRLLFANRGQPAKRAAAKMLHDRSGSVKQNGLGRMSL